MKISSRIHLSLFIILFGFGIWSCAPYVDADIEIPSLPEAPSLSIAPSNDNPNIIVVKDVSDGFFSRVWELPGGSPNKSELAIDSILYTNPFR